MGVVATAAEMKARWAEFAKASDVQLELYIAAAEAEVGASWGALRKEGVLHHAAGHFAATPHGAAIQFNQGRWSKGENWWLSKWRELRRSVGMGIPPYPELS